MDFSLTSLFVATSGTLQASGSTDATTVGQIGLFRPDYSLATAGNIAAAKYFYIVTGRPVTGQVGVGSLRSDKIAASNVIDWYKTVAEDTANTQITTLTSFSVKCDDEVVVTLRVHSELIDTFYFNGLTQSVVVKAPCCNCGDVPCDQVTAQQIQDVVDELVAKLQANTKLSPYLSFARSGSLATSGITISGMNPQVLQNSTDIDARRSGFDRVWFRAFAYTGTPTLQDYFVEDECEGVTAVATVTQRSTYAHGASWEIKKMEQDYFFYQQSAFKELYRNPGWNGNFVSNVVDGTFYDIYYIKAKELTQQAAWGMQISEDFTIMVAFATGTGSAFETVLTAALGAPKLQSGLDLTSTTSTSTSTTTSTTAAITYP